MSKFRVLMKYSDGTDELLDEDDELFDTEEEAEAYGCEMTSDYKEGAEELYMSNPGDYPLDENDEADFEIIEID